VARGQPRRHRARNLPQFACQTLYLPQNATSPHAAAYLRDEYGRIAGVIEALTGRPITEAKWAEIWERMYGCPVFVLDRLREALAEVNRMLAEAAASPVTVSSVCAVFAESEVINHLTEGRSPEDICAGAVLALAERAAQVMKRVRPEPEYALTGGLVRVPRLRRALEEAVGASFHVPPDGLGVYAGAVGAALLARERLRRRTEPRPA
jgi:hypothetical protein